MKHTTPALCFTQYPFHAWTEKKRLWGDPDRRTICCGEVRDVPPGTPARILVRGVADRVLLELFPVTGGPLYGWGNVLDLL